MLYVADRETGTFIEEVGSIEEGIALIELYELQDRDNETYEPDFYDIVNEEHCSVL